MEFRSIECTNINKPKNLNVGPEPMLQWLKISNLVVDDDYQRELKPGNWKAIKRIASKFTWSRFSPVFVAPVEGGKYAIIDGQHRTHAAAICGIDEVPCQIVQMTKEEQAASFAAVNGLVTQVTIWQIFRAALVAKEEWALDLVAVAKAAGAPIPTSNSSAEAKRPGHIYGIKTFKEIADRVHRPTLITALSHLVQCEGYGDTVEVWDMFVLAPLLNGMCERPGAIANPAFREKLQEFPIFQVLDEVYAESRRRSRAGQEAVSKKDLLQSRVIDWIDEKFPTRILLPIQEDASSHRSKDERLPDDNSAKRRLS